MAVIEELDTGVLQLDRDNRITLLNGAAEHGLAQGRDRLEGQPIEKIEGIPKELLQAVASSRGDQRARRLHECRLGGGLYDCHIQPLDNQHLLLELFLRNPRQVLTRDLINEQVWGYDFPTSSNSLEVYVGYLRRKLEADGEPRLIQTVRGFGYVLKEA